MTHVALDRISRNIWFLPFRFYRFVLRFMLFALSYCQLFASTSSMLEQLYFLRETFAARVTRVFLFSFFQCLPSSKDRLLGSVYQQSSLRVELLITGFASIRCFLDDVRVIDHFVHKRSSFLVGRFSGARLIPFGWYRLHAFRSAKRQQSVSCLINRTLARTERGRYLSS